MGVESYHDLRMFLAFTLAVILSSILCPEIRTFFLRRIFQDPEEVCSWKKAPQGILIKFLPY